MVLTPPLVSSEPGYCVHPKSSLTLQDSDHDYGYKLKTRVEDIAVEGTAELGIGATGRSHNVIQNHVHHPGTTDIIKR